MCVWRAEDVRCGGEEWGMGEECYERLLSYFQRACKKWWRLASSGLFFLLSFFPRFPVGVKCRSYDKGDRVTGCRRKKIFNSIIQLFNIDMRPATLLVPPNLGKSYVFSMPLSSSSSFFPALLFYLLVEKKGVLERRKHMEKLTDKRRMARGVAASMSLWYDDISNKRSMKYVRTCT